MTSTSSSAETARPAAPGHHRSPLTWLAVIIGGMLLATILVLGFLGSFTTRARSYDPVAVSADDVTGLDVDVAAGNLTITCGSSEDFVLTQEDVTDRWYVKAEGDSLRVWQKGDHDWLPEFGFFELSEEMVALEVPQSMCQQNLGADLDVDTGSLDVEADLDAVSASVDAGSLELSGAATSVSASVDAGSLDLDVDGAETVTIEVSAGSASGSLRRVPQHLAVDVDAGSTSLALPAGNYAVNTDAGFGTVSNDLAIDAGGPTGAVDVKVEAGSVSLMENRR